MPYGSQEAAVIRTYLDTVLDLPWNKSSKDKIVLSKVQKALDKTHYGLDKVKKRIIEQLAVRVLSEKQKDRSSVLQDLRVSVKPQLLSRLQRQ